MEHSDVVPNPVSAHHALNTTHRLNTSPGRVLTVISRGLTLSFPQIAVIRRGCYHIEKFLTMILESVWDRCLFFFHFGGQPHKDM